jgi:DNA-binding NtrC family response regulator
MRRAFTGATKQRLGKFEEAHLGTIFLDEIGDIPLSVQTKLLRVLQEKSFNRIGGNASITVDTRIIAATHRTLELMMQSGDFREDLFYRLNVFPISLPPLRQRLEDIPLLAEDFLHRYSDPGGGKVNAFPGCDQRYDELFMERKYSQLQNLIKRAIIKTPGETITNIELPAEREVHQKAEPEPHQSNSSPPFKDYLSAIVRDAEEKYIRRMLRSHKGNINQIARLMEVDRKTLYRKMGEYSIDPTSYRV